MPQIRTLGAVGALVAGGLLVLSSVASAQPAPARFGPHAIDEVWRGTMEADVYTAPDGSRDQMIGRAGDDTLAAGDMRDVVRGNRGDDTIDGGPGRDRLKGNRGNDTIDGGEDGDWILGGSGADVIDGGPGTDVIRSGRGDDTITAADGRLDFIRCGRGQDTVTADEIDRVARNCENVTLVAP
jgi:Ca2+-binding RTX toxin-like protein